MILTQAKSNYLNFDNKINYRNNVLLGFRGEIKDKSILESPSRLNTNAVYHSWKNPDLPTDAKRDSSLSLFHMSDNHIKYKPLYAISTAVNELTKKLKNKGLDFLEVHSGDYGNGVKNLDKVKLQVALLNKLGINVSTIGNHDLDVGSKNLADALKDANFTTLAANLKTPEDSGLQELKAGKNPKIADSEVLKINGDYYKVYHNGKNFNVKLVDGKLLERIKIFNIYRYYDIVPKIVQTNFTDFTNFTNIQQKNYSIFNFFSDNR